MRGPALHGKAILTLKPVAGDPILYDVDESKVHMVLKKLVIQYPEKALEILGCGGHIPPIIRG